MLLLLLLLLQGDVSLHWPLVDSPFHTSLLAMINVATAAAAAWPRRVMCRCTGRWWTALSTLPFLPRLMLLLLLLLQGNVALHWPLVDSPGRLLQQLGQQELEAKRKQDGAAYLASLPGYR
jgi:hypothetical protein